MQRCAVVAALLLILLPFVASAGEAGVRPVGKDAEEVMIPLGAARSTSHINDQGYLVKESSQRYLQLRGATPEEVRFFTHLVLLTGSLPRATQASLLKSFTPDRLAGQAAMVAVGCSGTCVEHCSVRGCDPEPGGCSALICLGEHCPSSDQNKCTKTTSSTPVK